MAIRNLSVEEELSASAGMFPRAVEGRNVEEVLEDFAKIAAEKGIQLYSVRVKCGRFKWKFKPLNAGATTCRINVLAINTGGQTRLVVKFWLFGFCREMPQDIVVIDQQSSVRASECKFSSSSC